MGKLPQLLPILLCPSLLLLLVPLLLPLRQQALSWLALRRLMCNNWRPCCLQSSFIDLQLRKAATMPNFLFPRRLMSKRMERLLEPPNHLASE
jgi:hypothetical protein